MTNTLFGIAAIILYLAAGSMLAWRLFVQKNQSVTIPKTLILIIGLGGILTHAVFMYPGLFVPEGINLGFSNAISLIAWLMAVLLVLAAVSHPVENLGIVILPGAALAVLLVMLLPVNHILLTAQAVELKLHIFVSILAYSLLTVAAVHAALLAIQDRHLRGHHPGGFIRALPPLQTMEALLFQMITLGFILHTIALVSGAVYLEDMFAQHLVHKTILSIIAWLVFAILLWGRWRFGWRGAKAIHWTIGGFVLLLLAYVGSKGVAEVVLGH